MKMCCIHQCTLINELILLKAVVAAGGISVGLLLSKHSSQYNLFFLLLLFYCGSNYPVLNKAGKEKHRTCIW